MIGLNALIDGKTVELASFDFNADSTLKQQKLNPHSANVLTRSYTYTPTGWLRQIIDPYFKETLHYTRNGYNDAGYFSGKIASAEYEINGLENPGAFITSYGYAYKYNALGRLVTAKNYNDDQWSLGVGEPITYDENGNQKKVKTGDLSKKYQYYQHTDRLKNTAE